MQERKASDFLSPEPLLFVVDGVKLAGPLMVETVAHNAPATDLMVKDVAAAKMTYVVAVKLLAPDDAVVEEDVLVVAFVN